MASIPDSIVVACVDEMVRSVGLVPSFTGKAFHVYSEEELAVRLKGLSYPCAAVVYDGMTSVPSSGGGIGASAAMVISVMIFFRMNTISTADPKEDILSLLDGLRRQVRKARSPTGHVWQFQHEAPAQGKTGILAYVQRWSTAVQLVG
jgi:hypothetical protein